MDTTMRIKMVKAMEFISRQINDEGVFEFWLVNGVADGDIKYADLDVRDEDREDLEIYIDDEDFADLMDSFLLIMKAAQKSGGLCCDGIVSKAVT